MRILVTGGAGFIGSHITELYLNNGYNVDIIDNLSTGSRDNLDSRAVLYEMDIRSPEAAELIKERKYDIINHQAAQINLRTSVDDPEYDVNVNIIGSINLIKAAVETGVKYFIFASSGGAVYGSQEYYPADEKHPCVPTSPYGINKLTIEKYLYFYRISSNMKWCALRYSNVFGPRQNPLCEAGVVSIFTNALLTGKECFIFGDGKQTRDFVYVKDVAEASLLAAEKRPEGPYNICTGIETNVLKIYDDIARLTGAENVKKHKPPVTGEVARSVLVSKKAADTFSWYAKTSFEEGLRYSVEYFKEKIKK